MSSRKQAAGRGRAAWAASSSLRQQGEQPSRAVFGEAGRGWVEIYMNERAKFFSLSVRDAQIDMMWQLATAFWDHDRGKFGTERLGRAAMGFCRRARPL